MKKWMIVGLLLALAQPAMARRPYDPVGPEQVTIVPGVQSDFEAFISEPGVIDMIETPLPEIPSKVSNALHIHAVRARSADGKAMDGLKVLAGSSENFNNRNIHYMDADEVPKAITQLQAMLVLFDAPAQGNDIIKHRVYVTKAGIPFRYSARGERKRLFINLGEDELPFDREGLSTIIKTFELAKDRLNAQ